MTLRLARAFKIYPTDEFVMYNVRNVLGWVHPMMDLLDMMCAMSFRHDFASARPLLGQLLENLSRQLDITSPNLR